MLRFPRFHSRAKQNMLRVYQFATIVQRVEALRQVKRRDNESRLIDR
jgi:hypothetical protein